MREEEELAFDVQQIISDPVDVWIRGASMSEYLSVGWCKANESRLSSEDPKTLRLNGRLYTPAYKFVFRTILLQTASQERLTLESILNERVSIILFSRINRDHMYSMSEMILEYEIDYVFDYRSVRMIKLQAHRYAAKLGDFFSEQRDETMRSD